MSACFSSVDPPEVAFVKTDDHAVSETVCHINVCLKNELA